MGKLFRQKKYEARLGKNELKTLPLEELQLMMITISGSDAFHELLEWDIAE